MNLLDLRTRFRNEVSDNLPAYLWSDDQVTEWINEAQDQACRRALLLVDSTSVAAKYPFLASAAGVNLHPSVIFVRRASLASANITLTPLVARTMDEEVPGWEGAMPSTPRVFVPDWQTDYLKFYPPAQSADTLNATVVRTPLLPMVEDEDVPEIRLTYHAHLLDWVKFRAYSVHDTEMFDQKKADKFEAAFIRQFGQSAAIDEHWAIEQYYDIGAN